MALRSWEPLKKELKLGLRMSFSPPLNCGCGNRRIKALNRSPGISAVEADLLLPASSELFLGDPSETESDVRDEFKPGIGNRGSPASWGLCK